MTRKKSVLVITGVWAAASIMAAHMLKKKAEETSYTADLMKPIEQRRMGFYEKHVKRLLDIGFASAALTLLSPVYAGVAVLVRIKLGSPVLFTQDRPGLVGPDGRERIFKIYKFRSMTDEKDANGNLMPDEVRLTRFGKKLRASSLDELPQALNILNGTMSVIGPRPLLVRDMVFMNEEQRKRHTAKPGLSGLAQINGRNDITWKEKLDWDLKYIGGVCLLNDMKILLGTVRNVFIKGESSAELDVTDDYGDALLKTGSITEDRYCELQAQARHMQEKRDE